MLGGIDITPHWEEDGPFRFIAGWAFIVVLCVYGYLIYFPYRWIKERVVES